MRGQQGGLNAGNARLGESCFAPGRTLLGDLAGVISLIAADTWIVDTSLVDVCTGVLAIAAFAALQR